MTPATGSTAALVQSGPKDIERTPRQAQAHTERPSLMPVPDLPADPDTLARSEALLRTRLAFSPDEVALVTGLSRNVVFDMIRSGELKSRKAGARRIIGRAQLEEFLAGGDAA